MYKNYHFTCANLILLRKFTELFIYKKSHTSSFVPYINPFGLPDFVPQHGPNDKVTWPEEVKGK